VAAVVGQLVESLVDLENLVSASFFLLSSFVKICAAERPLVADRECTLGRWATVFRLEQIQIPIDKISAKRKYLSH
jgi:hypothetical protein